MGIFNVLDLVVRCDLHHFPEIGVGQKQVGI
jgi:hypothetical protein